MKEWQRTPKQLVHEYCQKQKRPRPWYNKANGKPAKPGGSGTCRVWLTLPDPKKKEKSLKFLTEQGFKSTLEAEHAVALLALKHLGESIPHERKLPEPYRTMWLQLVGRADSAAASASSVPLNKKGKKKAAWKIKQEEEESRKAAEAKLAEDLQNATKKKKTKGVAKVVSGETEKKGNSEDELANWLKSINLGQYISCFTANGYRDVKQLLDEKMEQDKDALLDYGLKELEIKRFRRGIHQYRRNILVEQHEASVAKKLGSKAPAVPSVVALTPATKRPKKKVLIEASAAVSLTSSLKFVSNQERNITRRKRDEERAKKRQTRENLAYANQDARVYMSDKHRRLVEDILKSFINSNGSQSRESNEAIAALLEDDPMFRDNVKNLEKIGFKQKHAKKALVKCSNIYTDALDWLTLNLDEDDLPKNFDARGKQLDVVRYDKEQPRKLKKRKEPSTCQTEEEEFLYEHGFDVDPCREALGECQGNTELALRKLFLQLIGDDAAPTADDGDLGASMLQDEIEVMESMYGENFSFSAESDGTRIMSLKTDPEGYLLQLRIMANVNYPSDYPVATLSCDKWTHDQCKTITHGLSQQVKELQGQLVMYECSLWTQSEDFKVLMSEGQAPAQNKKANRYPSVSQPSTFNNRYRTDMAPEPNATEADGRPSKVIHKRKRHWKRRKMSKQERAKLSIELSNEYAERKSSSSAYKRMMTARSRLPAWKQDKEVLRAVAKNQVVLISGETGCGKTTQVPQFILDHYISNGKGGDVNIICTQPRRLAAIGVAGRVADEQCSPLGSTIGYQVRMDKKVDPRKTRLTFCTTGILLRRLHGDRTVEGVTHILVDEVHERDVDTDFLLAILKEIIKVRKDLKIILMSATMDTSLFVNYFGSVKAPVVKIPGFVHPVKEHYLEEILEGLRTSDGDANGTDSSKNVSKAATAANEYEDEKVYNVKVGENRHGSYGQNNRKSNGRKVKGKTDYNLVAKAVMYADHIGLDTNDDGAILVFMSGTMEINRAIEATKRLAQAQNRLHDLWILPLHGSLSSYDQNRVFQRPKRGMRKVVVSTNVAETSITIDDCVFVIDSGRMKEMQYDPYNRMSCLVETWVSKANARQRRGRAGRVRPGHCLRLFSKSQLDSFSAHQSPEIHRTPLERLCLQIRYLELGKPKEFLSKVIEPPSTKSVISAIRHLRELNAFKDKSSLTPLGQHLASMPVDAQVGKMLIYGAILRCPSQILTIAAAMCTRSPFLQDPVADEAKMKFGGGRLMSDHIAILRAFEGYKDCTREGERRSYCTEHGLHNEGMRQIKDLRSQLARALNDAGFVGSGRDMARLLYKKDTSRLDKDPEVQMDYNVLKAALCAGMYPNVVRVQLPEKRYQEVNGGAFEKSSAAREIKLFCKMNDAEVEEKKKEVQEDPSKGSRNTMSLNQRVFLHPSSALFKQGSTSYNIPWLVYFQKVRTSKVFLRDASVVPPYALLLFGGAIDILHEKSKLVMDNWMYFQAPARIGVLVRELRKALDKLLIEKIEDPSLSLSNSPIIDAILLLLRSSGM